MAATNGKHDACINKDYRQNISFDIFAIVCYKGLYIYTKYLVIIMHVQIVPYLTDRIIQQHLYACKQNFRHRDNNYA